VTQDPTRTRAQPGGDVPAGSFVGAAFGAVIGVSALLAVVGGGQEPAWLLLLVPAAWLGWDARARHRRAAADRRAVDTALRSAHDLIDAGAGVPVVAAAGARDLFAAEDATVELGPAPTAGDALVAPLDDGDEVVGRVAVRLPRQRTASPRDKEVLAAYADTVAAAVRNAAAVRRLSAEVAAAAHRDTHDPLTGLPNRAALAADGAALLAGLDRDRPVALLLVDVDDFAAVNRILGNSGGDALLTCVADRLTDAVRDDDLVARTGDDEFVVLVPDVPVLGDSAALDDETAPLPQAVRRARDLLARLTAPTEIRGFELVPRLSAGVVVAAAGAADVAELLRRAAVALAEAKAAGGGVVAYERHRDSAGTDHLVLLAELRAALAADDELVLEMQPEVDLHTGVPTGVEALTRWQHPRLGRQLAPAEFMPVVESGDLLAPFTRYVLDRSLAAAAAWAADGIDVPVSVNLSARSLLDPTLPAQIADALRRQRVAPSRLVLEITETMRVAATPVVDEVLAGLRSLGVQLSVDDFGTGFSTLELLTRVTVDELKVDRAFVGRMTDAPEAAAIVRSTVDLGRLLNVRVVAEGVETADQRTALIEMGCTAAQGYHFCKPLPVDRISAKLQELGEGSPAKIVPLRADGAS
jgi:diguanylate cyclase (GGDEF)-like protein